jgi:uncharacterized SAM-binding protein YcdF (DUF218 family)
MIKAAPRRCIPNCVRQLLYTLFILLILWFGAWLAARWLIVSAPLDRADAIVVLSGSSTLSERAEHAARLYSEHRAERIILTSDNQQGGWSSTERRNPYFYEILRNELIRGGVPPQNIDLAGPAVHSTREEAVALSQYLKVQNLHSILIVTSSYHSRRALWTFRSVFRGSNTQVGLDPVPTGIQTPLPGTWWLHQKGWEFVFVEYLKLIYYRLSVS